MIKLEKDKIIKQILSKYDVSIDEILTKSRKKNIINCKVDICHHLRSSGMTYSKIGSLLGMNHSSIVHLLTKRKKYITDNLIIKQLQMERDRLRARINAINKAIIAYENTRE